MLFEWDLGDEKFGNPMFVVLSEITSDMKEFYLKGTEVTFFRYILRARYYASQFLYVSAPNTHNNLQRLSVLSSF